MKVVIFCGGLGTRLREETEFRPKPMVHIGTKPILWHIMKLYAYHGFTDFVLALGYKGDMIKNYFIHYEFMNSDITVELGRSDRYEIHNSHGEVGWRITLVYTGDRALKGARLKRVESYIDGDDFMVTYGDGLADIDLRTLLSFHQKHGKLATVTGINPSSRFGKLRVHGNKVTAFHEKPDGPNGIVNGGFFVFSKEVFRYLSSDDTCDLEVGPLERIAEAGELMVYRHAGFWACMDTQRDMDYLNDLWSGGKAQWKIW